MRTARRSSSGGGHGRRATAAIELAMIMPVMILLLLGCLNFGRFANALIAVTSAARAGAGVGIMGHYPDSDPSSGAGLVNWQRSVCTAVANELGMTSDFTPAGSSDPAGFTNSQGLYVQAVCCGVSGSLWCAQVTARYPFQWWGITSSIQPQQTVVFRAIR